MSERYEIREKIGQGGRGFVYRALDTRLKREVAIKRIPVEPGASAAEIEKVGDALMKEATAMSVLNHPNIVSIYDVQTDAEGGFVVMELLNGETLHDVVKRNVLTLEDFHSVAQQTLEALIAAGASNMLHRDLKPGNIMLVWLPSNKFQVKVLDFGLAKISAQPSLQTVEHGRSIVGTIYFMAPEQFELRELSAATDLYAMGCVYYFCLTGKYPFDGDSMAKVMTAHLQGTYEPLDKIRPDLPRHLCQWVMWLMNRDGRHRPQTAAEALERLPLATSKDGNVYVVQALDVEDPYEAVDTGQVHFVKPADLVADPGRPVTKNPAPLPSPPSPRTSGVPATTGRMPTAATTGRVPTMNTGRVPRMNTGRVNSLPPPAPTGAQVPIGREESSKGSFPVWILLLLVPLLAGAAFAGYKIRLASDYPIHFQDGFVGRSGLFHASAPSSLPLPITGRTWIATPGLTFDGKTLTAAEGRQIASFDLSGTYVPADTIRIIISGLKNPTSTWFGFGLSHRPAPSANDGDLIAWVGMNGDKNSSPGSGKIHEQGFGKRNIDLVKDFWKTDKGNDIELVVNCQNGQGAVFVNGVRAVMGPLKDGGFPDPPTHLLLFFQNVGGTTVEGISIENLGPTDLLDIGPANKASRSFLMSIPEAPATGTPAPAK